MLIASAKRVLERSGWWGFKVSSVLKEASLSTRSFYRHFDCKDELLLALTAAELEDVARSIEAATNELDSCSVRVQTFLSAVTDRAFDERHKRAAAMYAAHWRELLPEYAGPLSGYLDAVAAPLEAALAEGARTGELVSHNPNADARAILAWISCMVYDAVAANGADSLEEIRMRLFPFIARALHLPA